MKTIFKRFSWKHLCEFNVVNIADRCVSSLLIGTEFTRLLYIRNGGICSSSLIGAADTGLAKRLEKSIYL